mgnify:CR=1 FL=1
MILFISVLISIVVLMYVFLRRRHNGGKYDYKCFLLTVKDQKERQERFFKSHKEDIPIEVIYGADTRKVKVAREFEEQIEPDYFEKAIQMHYDPEVKRPDITYFNLGAIGCFMGHMDFYKRCFSQGLKYAVIFEDNVIVKSDELYNQIQSVIDEKGDDFEMCFFHCLSRLPDTKEGTKYHRHFLPMDNHVDMKHEDLIEKGARVYYKDLREYMLIDRTHKSMIGHNDHGMRNLFSRQNPAATPDDIKWGY